MQFHVIPSARPLARPRYVWLAFVAALSTGIAAIPVGLMFMLDPSGGTIGLTSGWIEATPFGSYFVPGLYLLAVNGLGMLLLAVLIVLRHWSAPWLTAILGVGLIIWILVQLAVLPERMVLQWIFLGTGLLLGLVALSWLRQTGQLRLW